MTGFSIIYNEVEFAPAALGLNALPVLTPGMRQSAKTFTWRLAGANPAADPPIPYGAQVVIKLDGNPIFIGYQTSEIAEAVTGRSGLNLVFSDTWWLLEQTAFRQTWQGVLFLFTRACPSPASRRVAAKSST